MAYKEPPLTDREQQVADKIMSNLEVANGKWRSYKDITKGIKETPETISRVLRDLGLNDLIVVRTHNIPPLGNSTDPISIKEYKKRINY
jgi:hypothetical protein